MRRSPFVRRPSGTGEPRRPPAAAGLPARFPLSCWTGGARGGPAATGRSSALGWEWTRALALPTLAVVALACATSAPAPYPDPAARSAPAAEDSPTATASSSRAVAAALAAAPASGPWRGLEITTECRTDRGYRTATVFGSGVAIRDRSSQVTVPLVAIARLLRELRSSGFARWPESFGEAGEEEGLPRAGRPEQALRATCLVRLRLPGIDKQVVQLARGPQSRALARLARRILSTVESPSAAAVVAAGVTDGLRKVAAGELAPETLTIELQRRLAGSGGRAVERGWMLQVHGGEAAQRTLRAAAGWSPWRRLALAPSEVEELARTLAEEGFGELPTNLWAADYTDLTVAVLDQRRAIQARSFSGMDPRSAGAAQDRFDRLLARLESLYEKVAAAAEASSNPSAQHRQRQRSVAMSRERLRSTSSG